MVDYLRSLGYLIYLPGYRFDEVSKPKLLEMTLDQKLSIEREVYYFYSEHGLSVAHIAMLLGLSKEFVSYKLQDMGIDTKDATYKKIGGNFIRVSQ